MEGGKGGTVEGVEDVTRSICVWCGDSEVMVTGRPQSHCKPRRDKP